MKILQSKQVQEVDAYTIENEPILSINLMERAAGQCRQWIRDHIEITDKVNIFIGPGNNGGDGLAIARQLADNNYEVFVFLVKITDKLSPDAQRNLKRLEMNQQVPVTTIASGEDFPVLPKGQIVIDGLFGSGLSRPLEGFPAQVVKYLNSLDAIRIAIDIPSGLFGEDNSENTGSIFKAHYTLTFQFPSLSFFYPENEDYVGQWNVLPIGLSSQKIQQLDSPYQLVTKDFIKNHLITRKRFAHKGNYGHTLLICGGYGKMGAAVMAAQAALRTGAGLVTVHLPKIGYQIMQTSSPEIMISLDPSDELFTQIPEINQFSVIGTGPGIGTHDDTRHALKKLLEESESPLVLDADALNIISEEREFLTLLPKNSILTPHPKEFERLAGKAGDHYTRLQKQIEFSKTHRVIVVLKGGNTSVTTPEGSCFFNITGNPGMATAGSGDVLTGMITSLFGQGYQPWLAAIIGVYLHGLSGDLASEQGGMEALTATDLIRHIGNAFNCIQNE